MLPNKNTLIVILNYIIKYKALSITKNIIYNNTYVYSYTYYYIYVIIYLKF
jgi:hypothetical protein